MVAVAVPSSPSNKLMVWLFLPRKGDRGVAPPPSCLHCFNRASTTASYSYNCTVCELAAVKVLHGRFGEK